MNRTLNKLKLVNLNMRVRENSEINPILLRFGVALAFSLAGFLFSRFRTRRIKPSITTLPSDHPSDNNIEVALEGGRDQDEDDVHAAKAASIPCFTVSEGHILDGEEKCINKLVVEKSPTGLSPSCSHSEDEYEFLLPEFNDLEKELDFGATIIGNCLNKGEETPRLRVGYPNAYVIPQKKDEDYEQEIQHLRTKISMLQERERNLETQLLEYHGLREQETAIMELRNRLKISNMEAKMFNLKVETLKSEKRILEARVADHAKVVAELEAAKEKVQLLQKKIRCEAQQNREQIIALQQRVAKLQEQECKVISSDRDIQSKLQELKDLESEAEELRKANSRLHFDNSELARRLDSTQVLANSVMENPEADALKEESERLRQENEDLMKEIERLQADRCLDVEELVYLRWINACLRYELRNYQPPPGKTVARDLSKSLSPTSEKKAKQLILEYANTDGMGEGGAGIMDYDSDQWSFFSLASFLSDSGECDDDNSSVGNSSAARTNTSSKVKFLRKLRRLLRGKDSHDHHQEGSDLPHFSTSIATENDDGAEGHKNEFSTPSSRISLESHRMTDLKYKDRRNRYSMDVGRSKGFIHRRLSSGDLKNRLGTPSPDSLGTAKSELVKYAEALKDSDEGTIYNKFHKRSTSYI